MTRISDTITPHDIIVSGARSTGSIHIGNYFGAIRHFVSMSKTHTQPMYFFIADWHSLTTHTDPTELRKNILQTLATYLGCGLDPERACIYIQSDVPAIAELYLYLNMMANLGELERTTTFKEKVAKNPNNVNAGLLTYPVLMAADVLIHRGTKVPVGRDQAQHVEMIRTFGNRFNHVYNTPFFDEAEAFSYQKDLTTIPSLSGTGKMSKSDDPNSAILLIDDADTILQKVKKAKTDSGPQAPNSPLSLEIQNIFKLMELCSSSDTIAQFADDYAKCTIRYGDLKTQLAKDMAHTLAPIREKILDYLSRPDDLWDIALSGAQKANISANETIMNIREIIGVRNHNKLIKHKF